MSKPAAHVSLQSALWAHKGQKVTLNTGAAKTGVLVDVGADYCVLNELAHSGTTPQGRLYVTRHHYIALAHVIEMVVEDSEPTVTPVRDGAKEAVT